MSHRGVRVLKEFTNLTKKYPTFFLLGTCIPSQDNANRCQKVSGQIYVFGSDMEETVNYTRSMINFAIGGSLSQVLGLGVKRVEAVGFAATDSNINQEDSGLLGFPLPVICGLVLSAICIILGIVLLVLYVKKDNMRHRKLHKRAQSTMVESSTSGSFRYFTPDGKHIDETEDASCTSDISSVQIDFERGRVSKIPSDNIKVQFDTDYESSWDESETSSRASGSRSGRYPREIMSHPPHYLDNNGRYLD